MIKKALLLISTILPYNAIANSQYYYHGEKVEICEIPREITYRSDLNGMPYFIRYGEEYPSTYLTVVIWSNDLRNLEINPSSYFLSNNVCIAGEVTMFRSMPQIILRDSSQIRKL